MKRLPAALIFRYAKALFAAALADRSLPLAREGVLRIGETLRENPELMMLLNNPRLSREKVRGILTSLAVRLELAPVVRNFLNLLLDKDRLDILTDLPLHFEKLWRDSQGELEVTVSTAVPVQDSLREQITSHLAKQSGKKPLVTWTQDPSLLGGIIIRWPDHVFDGSLSRKLENLKNHLAQTASLAGAEH